MVGLDFVLLFFGAAAGVGISDHRFKGVVCVAPVCLALIDEEQQDFFLAPAVERVQLFVGEPGVPASGDCGGLTAGQAERLGIAGFQSCRLVIVEGGHRNFFR